MLSASLVEGKSRLEIPLRCCKFASLAQFLLGVGGNFLEGVIFLSVLTSADYRPLLPMVQDIVSGNCAVHNTMLFDHPQKSVLRAPWRYAPTQFWTPACKNVQGIAPAAIAFYAHPGLLTLPGLASAALFG